MNRLLRFALGLTAVCLVASVAALLAGVGRVEQPLPLRFEPDPFVVPADAGWPGEHDFEVVVLNRSSEPARIVGAEDFCGAACFSGIGLPTVIPAGGRGKVVIRVRANRPGSVASVLKFYTDRPTQPKLAMRIEGDLPGAADDGPSIPTGSP